ncbi:MAG: PEP-CTERM system TPR-repeat protein PrsT [Sulfuriferula multivorans]|uniref:PEP-CTERM system TPR-repeat protein PrsT n=1 Tax=Sulfuriferula multivorans TaxID=1559896 RepID=A0A7C9K905_9PROT|nr:PEP-CTERM system TPR-repeat protein PrsT [Sulfuriferula multivorans]
MTQHPFFLAFTLAASLTLYGCDRSSNFTEQEHIQRAKDLEGKGQLKESIIELKNALQKNPESPQARLLLGQIYLKTSMGAAAEKELTQAEKLGVNRESIKPLLGEALLLMGEYTRIIDEIEPGDQTSKLNLARILQIRANALLRQGKLKEACVLFQQSLNAHPSNPPAYWGLAQCAVAEHNIPKAKEWLDAALDIKDMQAKTWVHQGDLSLLNNDVQGAQTAYANALKLEPNNLEALAQRISVNLSVNQLEKARKDLDHLLKIAPKTALANYLQALFFFQQEKYPEARSALQEVFKTTEDHAPSLLLAGATSYALGSYQQTETYINRVLSRFPNNPFAMRVLAASQLKQGQADKALKTLTPLLSPDSKDSQALALASEAYLAARDYNAAMSYLQRASDLAPESGDIKMRLASRYLAEGESDKALTNLQQATKLSTKPGEADMALVLVLMQRKDFDAALQAITAMEKKLPNNPVTQNLRAAALLGKRDNAGARKALEQALAIQPNFVPATLSLSRLDIADQKLDAARTRLEAAFEKNKQNTQIMMALADLSAIENKGNEYANWLEKAVKATPKDIKPRAALTRYYLSTKDNAKALSLAREAVNNAPDNPEAQNLLGATHMALGNKTAAITAYTRILLNEPQSPGALIRLSLAQMSDKQYSKARANLHQAIKIQPDLLPAYKTLIDLELEDNKPDAALQIARQLQARQPKSSAGFEYEADINLGQKKYLQAAGAYAQALAKGAGSTVLIKRHRALTLAGDAQAADLQLNTWVKEHPADSVAHSYLAEFLMQAKRNKEAISQYQELIKTNPTNIAALNNLATLYQREKDSRAIDLAERALKLAPNHPGIQDTLGWILVEHGQMQRGLELLHKAVSTAPKEASIRFHYAYGLARAGKKAEAQNQLKQLLASGHAFPEREQAKALLQTLQR